MDPAKAKLPVDSGKTDPSLEPVEEAAGIDLGDFRLSWIYKLKKDQIDAELEKFQLDTSGTVDDKKRRLVRFIREGCASPQPRTLQPIFPPVPPPLLIPPPRPATANVAIDLATVHKWGVHFNGKGDPAAFLERLDEICSYTSIRHEQLLPLLPELLQGPALLWCRNNRTHWRTWDEFVQDFRVIYFSVNYLEELEAEIGRRLQKVDEPAVNYITDLQTLIRRHGDFSPVQELRWLYRNLLPDYRQYIHRSELTDIPSLIAKIKEFETLRHECQKVYQKPTAPATRVQWATTVVTPPPAAAAAGTRGVPDRSDAGSKTRTAARGNRPLAPTNQQFDRGVPANRPAPSTPSRFDRGSVCWRCGKTGHIRSQCRSPPRLFCSHCGRNGVMTRDCGCMNSRPQENRQGTVPSRGPSSSAPTQPREN